jgi:hypothetical protein
VSQQFGKVQRAVALFALVVFPCNDCGWTPVVVYRLFKMNKPIKRYERWKPERNAWAFSLLIQIKFIILQTFPHLGENNE